MVLASRTFEVATGTAAHAWQPAVPGNFITPYWIAQSRFQTLATRTFEVATGTAAHAWQPAVPGLTGPAPRVHTCGQHGQGSLVADGPQ